MQFQVSSRRENSYRDTWVIKSRALRKVFSKQFCFIDGEDNTSTPLNRGGIADLPLFRTLLAIRQKSREPSFWEVMDSFVLLAYANLAASTTLLQWLLAWLDFTLEAEDLSFWYKRKKWFLWAIAAAEATKEYVVGTFKNICTVVVYCGYIKDAFAGFC